MGLKKWLLNKGLFYIFMLAIAYIVAAMLNMVPKPLRDLANWLGSNFTLITILLVSFMVFWIIMRLTAPKRSQTT